MNKTGTKQFPIGMIGDVVQPLMEVEGLQKPNVRKQMFWRPGVKFPNRIYSQSVPDDMSIAKFGMNIQFYDIFYGENYANLTGVLKHNLKLNLVNVDMLLFNASQEMDISRSEHLLHFFNSTCTW